jgi:hypothetical protein
MSDQAVMKCTIATLFLLMVSTSPAHAATSCSGTSGHDLLPLVELFTSEGCDSCPPADRWLSATFAPDRAATASVLAFHVDYWVRLGWKDRFAAPQFTSRQYAAMRANGATFVYTPQVLVQGREVEAGARAAAEKSLSSARARPPRAAIELSIQGTSARLVATVDAGAKKSAALWLVYTDNGLVTDVKAGENRGVRLTHDHVVRALYGPYPVDVPATVDVRLPQERGRAPALVAFVQDTKSGEVLQTLTVPCDSLIY